MESTPRQFEPNAAAPESGIQEIKKLRKKIRKLVGKRWEEISEIKRESVRKYLRTSQKAQLIIDGTDNLSLNFVSKYGEMVIQSNEKPAQETQPSNNQTTTVKNEGIEEYWKKVLQAEYNDQFNFADLELLGYLREISVKDYNKYKISLNFHIKQGHPIVEQGVYCRTLLKDEDGVPVEYEGNSVANYDSLESGFMKIILVSETVQQYLECLDEFFQLLCTQIIPRSLIYYMKARVLQGLELH